MNYSHFKALTFDVYGTLIDWEPHIAAFFRGWAERNGVEATDAEILAAYDDGRAHYQQRRPAMLYPEVLKSAYAYVCDRWRTPVDADEQRAFAESIHDWEPFADTVDSLAFLKRHFALGALSNIDDASFAWTRAKLGVEFDIIVTAERAGAYKPDMPHFLLAANDLGKAGISIHEQLHVAQSLRADIRPANDLRLAHVWINRGGRALGQKGHGAELAVPEAEFASMADFVAVCRQELG